MLTRRAGTNHQRVIMTRWGPFRLVLQAEGLQRVVMTRWGSFRLASQAEGLQRVVMTRWGPFRLASQAGGLPRVVMARWGCGARVASFGPVLVDAAHPSPPHLIKTKIDLK